MIDLNQTCSSVNMFTRTKEKPTKPGFYWKKENSDGVTNISIVNLRDIRAGWDLPDNAEWSGPIFEPIAGSYQSE